MTNNYTLQSLLDELKENISPFKEGMIFETIKSIYPDSKVSKMNKNILINGKRVTKPLASNRKAKNQFVKENSVIKDFFSEMTRGDFLKVVKIENKVAKCINMSLKEDIVNKYYLNEVIDIDLNMIVDGYVKQYKRKVDKFFN